MRAVHSNDGTLFMTNDILELRRFIDSIYIGGCMVYEYEGNIYTIENIEEIIGVIAVKGPRTLLESKDEGREEA